MLFLADAATVRRPMILSHKHKFIFIKGQKVAGTSAEIALSQVCGPDDIITPITTLDERHRLGTAGEPRNYASHLYPASLRRIIERRFIHSVRSGSVRGGGFLRPRYRFVNHMELRAVLRLVPRAAEYQLLYVERSPYAKVMSLANWVQNHQHYARSGKLPTNIAGVADAVDRLIEDGSITRVRNIDRYRDLAGRIAAKPWSSATLQADLDRFLESRGLDPIPLVSAKRGANSDEIDPAATLRPDQIATINKLFAEEFERFGWPMIG